MDAAYDAAEIIDHARGMGHVPIIDPKNAGRKVNSTFLPGKPPRELTWAERQRYAERTMVERVYARLKDEFGGRHLRVRGAAKVMAHLMFGVLALTADQILRLAPAIACCICRRIFLFSATARGRSCALKQAKGGPAAS